jgi:outer membrane protein assembly factor BamB
MKTRLHSSVLVSALAFTFSASASAGDWPQWRGPNRDDVSTETGLLKEWPEGGPEKVWMSKEIGLGYSGPAVANGRIFILGATDGKERLFCLDEKTGKKVWESEVGDLYKNNWGDGPRSTPTVDGAQVYAMGAQGNLVCVAAADGMEMWRQSMTELGGKVPGWGYCESPLIDGEKVICTPGGDEGAIAALDKKSGKVLWQSKGLKDGAQYSSLIAVEEGGQRQYVQLFMKTLAGVDAKNGDLLWSTEWGGQTAVIPTPIFADGCIYVASGYGVGCKLVRLNDGDPEDVWENKVMKNHHGGVIKVGDFLYGYSDGRGWTCQDFKSGEEIWSNNNDLKKGAIACADGMLYCLGEDDGTLVLIDASDKGWREHGRFTLEPQTQQRSPQGRVWTHPVIANGKLYLRDQEIFCAYDVKGE